MSIADYRKSIRATRGTGQATEHSYRPALQQLLTDLGGSDVEAINEPTQADYGAPDFIVELRQVPIGHIECKDVGTNLHTEEESEQIKRYRNALPNLILTDYLQFRWYVDGELRAEARLGRFDNAGRLVTETGGDEAVRELLANFYDAQIPVVGDSADLARRMASKTRLLRNAIEQVLAEDADNAPALAGLLASYREVLINDLSVEDFADLQAQTAAYGLFAARCLHFGSAQTFNRQSAVFADTTPFLRDVFVQIAGPNADSRIAWIIDDLALLLARADMAAVLEGFGTATRQEDPIVHFYEDFLAAYDPRLRELRGVYYTPEPVVSYIVRSVDWVLRDRFGLTDGLADTATVDIVADDGPTRTLPRVLVLDPAAGTGTFLREVVSHIRDDLTTRGLAGAWGSYVPEHLLPRLFGFELLMAAYTICHLKLAMEISGDAEQYTLGDGERLGVFLTNSLTEAHEDASGPMFAAEIVREAREADAVKRDHPVMVVIGNPPYSGHSANKGKWITGLVDEYKKGVAGLAKPGQAKWLSDDYVKFIRFAQWRISQTGEGVLGFVTNHSYLDNPTFRGMRKSLLETFDEIWLLDLHGNSKRKERSPGGGRDQNVFDIQQGVAIGIFVKHGGRGEDLASVRHADLWGDRGDLRSGKYSWLAENSLVTTDWSELSPRSPDYFFTPRDYELAAEYEAGWSIPSIFCLNGDPAPGIVTTHDQFAVSWDAEDAIGKIERFLATETEEDARQLWRLCKQDQWKYGRAKAELTDQAWRTKVERLLYRPFDVRATVFDRNVAVHRRERVMHHMLAGPNVGLCVGRAGNVIGSEDWDIAIAASVPTDFNLFRRGGNCLFPLYLYPTDDDALDLGVLDRTPNLAPEFIDAISTATALRAGSGGQGDLKSAFGPEDVFHYIYAVLHSPQYRRRYADFLRSDFPHIPVPTGHAQFAQLAQIGAQLTSLHLMTAHGDEVPAFTIDGSREVERVRYSEPSEDTPGRVWINPDQHFEGVSPQTWQLTIGGYQPAKKWLQDRKGRVLDFEDIQTYQRICAALAETPRITQQIDDIIEALGGWPIGAHRAPGPESDLSKAGDASEPQRITKALDTLAGFEFEDRESAWR
ncbi:MAG: N-6 DNA methylase [Acidimicrobiales bacterium]|nr:N-6 DNA methylase [Acidimicrobiales bacterium]MYA82862.1 N-6 DNA methylase [Acidimicrobiales bacterium]MYB80290.1 N-6 DNA methylase [Acidimicrobiales bacterium]MYH75182.1 N-6 DNA methylase [Acidimicrobiales bacterium]MYI12950.1 N-6 DNA methylase [Acidimicrobiales bacterium]